MWVIVLLAYGCPVPAIAKAFGLNERTARNWWQRAGVHCQQIHETVITTQPVDLQQVQADEIKGKVQGGVISPQRDKRLLQRVTDQVRQMALCRLLLLAVDGLPGYIQAFYPHRV